MIMDLIKPNLTKVALFIVLTLITFLLIALNFQPETVNYTALVLIMIPVYVVASFIYWLLSKHTRLLRIVKWIILIPAGFVVIVSLVSQFAPAKPPKDFLITYNFIDLANVDSLSKYRSCHGHQTVDQWSDEPVSNMQHYIPVLDNLKPDEVKIYAPFDGYVLGDAPYTMPDEGVTMVPASGVPWWPFNQWRFALNHTHLLPQFQHPPIHFVRAGTHVGYVNALTRCGQRNSGTQVRVGVTAIPPMIKNGNGEPYKKIDSVFRYMSDEVFEEYAVAFPDVKSREDFIFPKEWRQAHPCIFREGDAPNFEYRPEENDLKTRFAPAPS